MPVPSFRFVVHDEADESAIYGSTKSLIYSGIDPSEVPPYLERLDTGIIVCSGSHIDSKPRVSAKLAMSVIGADVVEIAMFRPISI